MTHLGRICDTFGSTNRRIFDTITLEIWHFRVRYSTLWGSNMWRLMCHIFDGTIKLSWSSFFSMIAVRHIRAKCRMMSYFGFKSCCVISKPVDQLLIEPYRLVIEPNNAYNIFYVKRVSLGMMRVNDIIPMLKPHY